MTSTPKKYPTLYGFDKNNKIKEWNISVEMQGDHAIMMYSYGYLDGEKVECKREITRGKNVGKSNETTPFQQAIAEASSRWKKKMEEGCVTDLNIIQKKTQNEQVYSPMLAHEYKKNMKKLTFPCYAQPKLDGYRMIFDLKGNCLSRTGKEYKILKNTELYKELIKLLERIQLVLDGELYVHDSSFSFENYGVLRKLKISNEGDFQKLDKIQYHVYDIIDNEKTLPFKDRFAKLSQLQEAITDLGCHKVKIVQTKICQSKYDADEHHQDMVQQGYEGSILRNAMGLYKCKYRSYDLLKYKDFDDDEFKIVDFTSETDVTNKDQKIVVWICETENGKRFKVPSKGTREERQVLYEKGNTFIGKKLWVQYFGLTNEGIPRFPKTKVAGQEAIRHEQY